VSENTFNLNDAAPVSMIGQFSAPAQPQTENFWGSLDLMLPAGTVQSGVASVSCSAAANVSSEKISKGTAPVNATAFVVVASEQRNKGQAAVSCLASVAVGCEVAWKGAAIVAGSCTINSSSEKVCRGQISVTAASVVVAIGNTVDAEAIVSLASMTGTLRADSIFKGWLTIPYIGMHAEANAESFEPEPVVAAKAPYSGRTGRVLAGNAPTKIYRSVWRDEMPDDRKKKNLLTEEDD